MIFIGCIFCCTVFYLIFRFTVKTSENQVLKDVNIAAGWHLMLPPVEKLAAGTIYRKNADGRMILVKELKVAATKIKEGEFTYSASVISSSNMIAEFFRMGGVNSDSDQQISLALELNNVVREVTDDMAVDDMLASIWNKVRIRADEKYYIIRETRAAKKINLKLTKAQVQKLSGEVNVKKAAAAQAGLMEGEATDFEVNKSYEKRMYVMYLPEEIRMVSANFKEDEPSFDVYPVTEFLNFNL